jgi:uncharacterized protein (TIGR02646 family)
MLRYPKGPEPSGAGLALVRSTPGAGWGSLGEDERRALREALVRDQRGLCCYCMQRIVNPPKGVTASMKIEHWHARAEDGAQLAWSNLLGACAGVYPDAPEEDEQGQPKRNKRGEVLRAEVYHCDTHRGHIHPQSEAHLFLHPAEGQGPNPRDFLRYLKDGTIRADDPRAARDVGDLDAPDAAGRRGILNLNAAPLRRLRKARVDFEQDRARHDFSLGGLQQRLKRLDEAHPAPEFVELSRYLLQGWLKKKP